MLFISLRDLRFRQRRFLIAIAGTALVFAMSLLMSGVAASFTQEAARTVTGIGADAWVVSAGASGPFTGFDVEPDSVVREIARAPGVRAATGIVFARSSIRTRRVSEVFCFGSSSRLFGAPPPVAGRAPRHPGELMIDERAGVRVGARVRLSGRAFTVVGITSGRTLYASRPTAYMSLRDAQIMAFGGHPLLTAVITRGVPTSLPHGFRAVSPDDARADALNPLLDAISTLNMVTGLLWLVAAAIIGAIVYLSAIERVREFAVLRATGAAPGALFGGLLAQTIVVALTSALLSIALAFALVPMFPMKVAVPPGGVALLPAVALVVGALASLSGLRRTLGTDPALAFGAP